MKQFHWVLTSLSMMTLFNVGATVEEPQFISDMTEVSQELQSISMTIGAVEELQPIPILDGTVAELESISNTVEAVEELQPVPVVDGVVGELQSTPIAIGSVEESQTVSIADGTAEKSQATTQCCSEPAPARITVRHIEPKGIGYNQGYTTVAGFFTPFWSHNVGSWIPFMDLRLHVFDDSQFASNAGLGLRYRRSHRAWGINTYYDYRQTSRRNYNQISAGLESLGRVWDFRINGYLPVGKKNSSLYNHQFQKFKEHWLFIRSTKEFAMKGANGEVGAHVNSLRKAPLYFAGGPYFLSGEGKSTWGGQLRASVDLFGNIFKTNKNVSLNQGFIRIEGNVSYDHIFKWIGQGQISFNMGLGGRKCSDDGRKLCNQETLISRVLQGVDRMEIIPVSDKHTSAKAIDPTTGAPYFFWFVDNTSHSAGTYEDPFTSLSDAQLASSPNDVIYAFAGDDTTTNMDAGIVLQDNQRFWGSGVGHNLPTQFGGIPVPALTDSSPMITNLGGNAITLANGNEVSGFVIPSPSGYGIFGTGVGSTTLLATTITGASGAGVSLIVNSGNSNLTLKGLNISGSTGIVGDAIQVGINGGANVTLVVANSSLTDNFGAGIGIAVQGSSLAADIVGNSILTNGVGIATAGLSSANVSTQIINNVINENILKAVVAGGDFGTLSQTIQGNEMLNNSSDAIYLGTSGPGTTIATCEQTILNNNISGNSGQAITVNNSTIDSFYQKISNNTISQNNNSGVVFSSSTITALNQTISNNTISQNSGSAIFLPIGLSYFNIDILNNTIIDNAVGGISITGQSTGQINSINIADCTILGSGLSTGGSSGGVSISSDPALALTVSNSTINYSGYQGIDLIISGTSSVTAPNTFLASNNTLIGNLTGGIVVNLDNGNTTTMTSTMENNTVSFNGLKGISFTANSSSPFMTTIQGNTATANVGAGINVIANSGADLVAEVLDNTLIYNVAPFAPREGFQASVDSSSTLCLDLEYNSSNTGYYLDNSAGGTFNLVPINNIGTPFTEVGTINTQASCP